LYARAGAAFTFRLVLQPLVVGVIAIRAGLRDASAGRPGYLWAIFGRGASRRTLIKEGWQDIARVFFLALAVDLVYQLLVLHWFYPLEALALASLVAVLPYLLLRSLVALVIRHRVVRPSGKIPLQ